MKLSAISIQRPVLAVVMTLVLVLFGILSVSRLPIRDYPDIESPIISVRTVYPGASAKIVETDVSTPLEEVLSGIESLKTISSSSIEEVSSVTLEFDLSRDLDAAANDVRDRVYGVRRWLPRGIEEPTISKSSGDAQPIMYLSLRSDRYTELEITDYAERYIKDRLNTVPGVSGVWIWGARRYAMRIWLDAGRLAAHQLTVQDVEEALTNQNVAIPSGRIEGDRLEFSVRTRGELQTPEQFNRLIVAYRDGYPIRLEEIGRADLGAEDDRKIVRLNGTTTVGMTVVKQSKGNSLAVAHAVKERLKEIQPLLPDGMTLRITSDSSVYIERSLHEVYVAMGISLALVVLVIFLFLGSARATFIPAVAIPASIVSTFTLLYVMGFSINVLTLLGLVLAIGLVVDDAIVMLENIHRRMEAGQPAMQAAMEGSREIGFAVIATTIALAAVFIPIAFLPGAVGRLFSELSLAVAGSVLISGFIALTLTPMMSATMLGGTANASEPPGILHRLAQRTYGGLVRLYRGLLIRALHAPVAVIVIGVASILVGIVLFTGMQSELAPAEDTGAFLVAFTAPEGSTIRYTDHYAQEVESLYARIPEIDTYWTWIGWGFQPAIVSRGGSWVTLKDWNERKRAQQEIVAELSTQLSLIPGVVASAVNPPALSHTGSMNPVQFVVGGPSYEDVERSAVLLLERAKAYPGLTNPDVNLGLNKPEVDIHVNRNKAADLGISVSAIGRTLQTLLGGRPITTFDHRGKEYPVIVKIQDKDRLKPADINTLYIRGHQGELIQLGNLLSIEETIAPRELYHYDKMRAMVLTAGVATGYTLGDALDYLERTAKEILPSGTPTRLAGESRQFKETNLNLYLTFFVAFIVIYLVLAAIFESFLHPVTILLTVPPAVTGALLTLAVFGGTLNIYSQVGMIMLIGLVSKNAILIVDFANRLRQSGEDAVSAIVEGAVLRLRPILMTTLATVLGAVPLALATGAGSMGRRQIGYVIVGGMIFSTILTLVIVPAVYSILCRKTARSARYTAGQIEGTVEPLKPATPDYGIVSGR